MALANPRCCATWLSTAWAGPPHCSARPPIGTAQACIPSAFLAWSCELELVKYSPALSAGHQDGLGFLPCVSPTSRHQPKCNCKAAFGTASCRPDCNTCTGVAILCTACCAHKLRQLGLGTVLTSLGTSRCCRSWLHQKVWQCIAPSPEAGLRNDVGPRLPPAVHCSTFNVEQASSNTSVWRMLT